MIGPETRTLWRPVGRNELAKIEEAEYRAFPPRLPEQPIFYPVLNFDYAEQIARDWNSKDARHANVGYVTEFDVRSDVVEGYEPHQVGARMHRELWVPAEELTRFNEGIVGLIRVVAEYRHGQRGPLSREGDRRDRRYWPEADHLTLPPKAFIVSLTKSRTTMHWLAQLVAPLNHVLFVIGADQVSVAELAGFITGAACVWLTVKAHIANFPVGLANDAFFLVLFLAAGLYADSGLQVVYLVLGVVGWWQWLYGGKSRTRLEAGRATLHELGVLAALVVLATWGLTVLLRSVNDVAPFWDALTTALSLAAQWLLNTKKLQNWYFWIAADLIYIPLYGVKHLWLTAVVYAVFLAMCFRGYSEWRRALVRPAARLGGLALASVEGAE